MNSSSFETNWNYNLFTKRREGELNKCANFLDEDKHEHTITHKIHSHLEEDISDFAFHCLQKIARDCERNISWDKHQKLVKLAGKIVEDFEHVYYKKGFFAKLFYRIMVALNLRHSEQEIRILHRSIKAPSLGEKISPEHAMALLEGHRHPSVTVEDYDKVALTGVFFESKLKEMLSKNEGILKSLKEPHLSIFKAHLKEQAIKDVYHEELPKRIQEGCYNPAIIPHEIDKILGPVVKISRIKIAKDTLSACLERETLRYAEHLTAHQLNYIKSDVLETIRLYLNAYPNQTPRNAFVLGRDLIRIAVYQEIFDKSSFTGSDHGSKHIHNNIEGANSLHDAMQYQVDYNDKDKFIERLIHFYHDIGYTVGLSGKSFSCCKDHPLIGAKMIEENREYFEYYLDKESADILWNGVLLHAIALPNLTPDDDKVGGMYPGMVRAVTSISDACAVTYDRKTQEFWEQPVALIALARLRLFLTQYPQYMAKLASLGKGEWESLDKENPLDVLAHDVFQNTKRILLKSVEKSDVPDQKKELFKQAILQQFNSFTTATTLGQLGGVLINVSAIKNDENDEVVPKYYPRFDLAPSVIYGTLHDLFGADIAQASFKKLADEFGGDIHVLAKEINNIVKDKNLHERSLELIKTGNACFKIHAHHVADSENKHMDEMQHALYRVIEKVEMISRAQYMSLSQKKQVMQNLVALREGKLQGCSSFPDFVCEYILPNLSIYQSSESIKDIQLLTHIVKENIFSEIHQADVAWHDCFELLQHPEFQEMKSEVNAFKAGLEKIKSILCDNSGKEKLSILRLTLVNAARAAKKMDIPSFEARVDEAIHRILENASIFIGAEQQFSAIENALKLALVSEEEYRFMRGKKDVIDKSECLARLCKRM